MGSRTVAEHARYIEDLKVGDRAERVTPITAEMVRQFAAFSGDDNPTHIDPDYAAKFNMPEPGVHGMLYVSLRSGVLGSELPGHASVYLARSVNFHGNVHVGDVLTARVTVAELDPATGRIGLDTDCFVGDKARTNETPSWYA
jgi:3-hydroxybutyryl-CoA dehydratase